MIVETIINAPHWSKDFTKKLGAFQNPGPSRLALGPGIDTPPIQAEPGALIAGCIPQSFFDHWYNGIKVFPTAIYLDNVISYIEKTVEVWNAYFVPKTLASIDGNVAGLGLELTGPPAAPLLYGALKSHIYTLRVSVAGAPAIDAKYIFNFVDVKPALVITGRRIVVWPFMPQTKFSEQLEWLTDILQAYSAEQRLALRTAPRQTLRYDFQLDEQQYSRAKGLGSQWAHRVYSVPVWGEASEIGDVYAGATTLDFDTSFADYHQPGFVVLWETDSKYIALETIAVSPSGVTLLREVDQDYANAIVMPARFARTLQGLEFSRSSNLVVKLRAAFSVGTNMDLGGASDYAQYRGKDVVTDRSVLLSDMPERITRPVVEFDNGSGPVSVSPKRGYVDRTEVLSLNPQSRAEVWRMRKWLHSRRGKQKSFWVPSWNRDLVLTDKVDSPANTAIQVRAIGYALAYGTTDILIRLNTGATLFNRVLTSGHGTAGNEILFLANAVGMALAISDVEFICFMKHVRLNTDRADIAHEYAGSASCSVAVIEVPEGD